MINPLLIDNDPEHRFAVLLRMAVWILFFLVLYLLRSFSVLVFLTFVFSYIQAHGVSKIQRYFKRRTYSVIFVFTIFVGALVGMGSYMVPQVINQAEIFADNFRGYVSRLDAEIIKVKNDYPTIGNLIPEVQVQSDHVTLNESGKISDSVSASVIPYALGFGSADHSVGSNFDIKSLTELLKNIGKPLLALLSSFLLALLFSFLIVLDLPRLTSSVRDLKDTKIGFIYEEVGGSLASFGRTLGHALEAQLVIAVINTVLTAIAIFFFGIATKLAFLSLIVFFCSFIPVAGVFLSSIPICLLVLEADGGLQGILLVGLTIWLIHLVEAYVLNPMIFGDRLHINPVLVLMILTIGGKLFGVWGLLLGVPICTYLFTDAIRYKNSEKIVG